MSKHNFKSTKLTDILKEMSGQPSGIIINGKQVDIKSIEIDGVDHRDYPGFSDAYISAASFVDGTPLTDDEIAQLEDQNYGLVNDLAHDQLFQEGEEEEFRPGGKMAADYYGWERDQERMKVCPKCHKKYISPEYGQDKCPRCDRAEKGIK